MCCRYCGRDKTRCSNRENRAWKKGQASAPWPPSRCGQRRSNELTTDARSSLAQTSQTNQQTSGQLSVIVHDVNDVMKFLKQLFQLSMLLLGSDWVRSEKDLVPKSKLISILPFTEAFDCVILDFTNFALNQSQGRVRLQSTQRIWKHNFEL